MKLSSEYRMLTKDILRNRHFRRLKAYKHHRRDIYHHCIRVSYLSYCIAKRLGLDYVAAARGGLLHDFFLYDWRKEGQLRRKKLLEKHGFTHASEALFNAKTHFSISNTEADIIRRHMFPLNPIPPRTAEGWIVTIVDKYITTLEIFNK